MDTIKKKTKFKKTIITVQELDEVQTIYIVQYTTDKMKNKSPPDLRSSYNIIIVIVSL